MSALNKDQSLVSADSVADLLRLVGSSTPFLSPIGSIVAELIAHTIPGKKLERVQSVIRSLDRRLARAERAILEGPELVESAEFADLVEDALRQAARAVSDERIEHIASLLYSSIAAEEFNHAPHKKMLQILGSLTDEEVIWLQFYSLERDRAAMKEFLNRYRNVLEPASNEIGIPQSEIERGALQRAYKLSLVGHGLLEESQTVGGTRLQGLRVSSLGKTLLRMISHHADPV